MEKKEKEKETLTVFMDKLRNTPPEKLSKYAKWLLKADRTKEQVWYDMKAVMK